MRAQIITIRLDRCNLVVRSQSPAEAGIIIVGAEQNTTTIVMMPSEFVTLAESMAASFKAK